MDKRLDTSRSNYQEDAGTHSKKTKKRSSKKSSVLGPWMNSIPSNQNSDMAPGMEYQQVMWQSNIQQNIQSNGQRLFTAASDPSMCGYAQMPMTYTMEPVSLPTMYRLYQPVPFSGVRAVHNRPRRHYNQNHPLNLGINTMANGYTSLQENGMESPMPVNYQNGDYTSLPPTANKTNEINGEELNSEHRRYSDPGLGSAEAPVHMQSEDSDSVDSGSSITTIGRSNKLVLSLIEQMTELKKSNSQLFKELNETKSELGSMKTKFTQCKYNTSSDYQPGMLSDLIREIRQANKTCEEGLVIKVKSMVEEKLNERSSEVTSLSNQILKLTDEKEESERRIAKLEEEVAALKLQAKREKLLDILRCKVIGEKDEETIDQGSIKAKRARSVSSDEEDEMDELDGPGRQQEDEEEDGDVDGGKGTTFTEKIDRFAVENGGKLSGPVTDL